jgi:hypothetical protein
LGVQVRDGVVGKSSLTKLTTNTGLLKAPEWQRPMEQVVAVNPDGTSLQDITNADSSIKIVRVDSGSQTVVSAMSKLNNLSLILELGNGTNGAKDLLPPFNAG